SGTSAGSSRLAASSAAEPNPAARASGSVTSASEITSTVCISRMPALVRYRRPATTWGRRHCRKSTVIDPSMMPSRTLRSIHTGAPALEVACPPLEDRIEACDPVARQPGARQLVAFRREQQELCPDPTQRQCHVQPLGLFQRATPVLLRVDDQHRDVDPV